MSGCSFGECFVAMLSTKRNVTIPSHASVWPPEDMRLIIRKNKNTKKIKLLLAAVLCINYMIIFG
jgi:hypothetical protein